jgi:hypothetical protein
VAELGAYLAMLFLIVAPLIIPSGSRACALAGPDGEAFLVACPPQVT